MKWTDEDHELVRILTEDGWSVEEISADTGLSVGSIKRSRRLSADKKLSADKIYELEKRIETYY